MKKYIRTESGIHEFEDFSKTKGEVCINHYGYRTKNGVCILGTLEDWKEDKQADTIEELCDELVVRNKANNRRFIYSKDSFEKRVKRNKTLVSGRDDYKDRLKYLLEYNDVYGAIWTDKGLIYVAKMNEKGEFELL